MKSLTFEEAKHILATRKSRIIKYRKNKHFKYEYYIEIFPTTPDVFHSESVKVRKLAAKKILSMS